MITTYNIAQKSDTDLGQVSGELAIPGRVGALQATKHLGMNLYPLLSGKKKYIR